MVYLIGTFGFICGFILGQMILYFILRNKSLQSHLEAYPQLELIDEQNGFSFCVRRPDPPSIHDQ
jgi:hypothetical protein